MARHMEKEGAEILLIIKASEFNVDEEEYIAIFKNGTILAGRISNKY